MANKYKVEKICGLYSGPGWLSSSTMKEEWAVVIDKFGIIIKTFANEQDAIDYCILKNSQ